MSATDGLFRGRRVIGLQVAQGVLDAVEVVPEHHRVGIDIEVVAQGAIEHAALAPGFDPGDREIVVGAVDSGQLLVARPRNAA